MEKLTAEQLKTLKEFEGRPVLLVAKVGSINYNLHDETSDQDFKVYVLPNFEDLYTGKRLVRSVVSDEVDYTVHDVRDFAQQLKKSNINVMEVLFAVEQPVQDTQLEPLFEMKEELARMNLAHLFDTCLGMFNNKLKSFEKGTKNSQSYVEKYGYDTKSFMNMYRVLDFLLKYEKNGFSSFLEASRYSEEEREYLLKLKHGMLKKDEAVELYEKMLLEAKSKKPVYLNRPLNEETFSKMESVVTKLFKDRLMK